MKKNVLIFCLACLCSRGYSQATTEPDNYKNFFATFSQNFNAERWDAIVGQTSKEFLISVPAQKLTDFLSDLKKQLGLITTSRFGGFSEKQAATYHVKMDKAWMDFFVALNANNQIAGLLVTDVNYNEILPLVRNKVRMQVPFEGEWTIFWGGDTQKKNYHVSSRAQKNAFDIVLRDSSTRSYRTNGKSNTDYYAFDKKLYAPCDGEIVNVIDGVADNIPGIMNPDQLTGNTVVIRSGKDEYVLMAHFKLNSIAVKKGQKVKAGDYIGRCGNSGNSSEPHLHLHIMDKPDLKDATGIKCFFEKITVNGKLMNDYSPQKGEVISR